MRYIHSGSGIESLPPQGDSMPFFMRIATPAYLLQGNAAAVAHAGSAPTGGRSGRRKAGEPSCGRRDRPPLGGVHRPDGMGWAIAMLPVAFHMAALPLCYTLWRAQG